jgi:hypothetical protein
MHLDRLEVVIAAIGTMMLLLPVTGLTLTYLLPCRRVGAAVALRPAAPIPHSLRPERQPGRVAIASPFASNGNVAAAG